MPNNTEAAGYQDYYGYDQKHEYRNVPGVMQVPIAQQTSGHRLIRLHGGYGTRTVKFAAERFGRPPVVPSAVDGTDDTLLGTTLSPNLPKPNEAAAGFDWRITGEYVYAQNVMRVPGTDAFPVGSFPFALPVQSSANDKIIASIKPPITGPDFSSFYNAVGQAVYDPGTGAYTWPFLALPASFFSETLV